MHKIVLPMARACALFVITAIMLGTAVTPVVADKRIVFDTIKAFFASNRYARVRLQEKS